jgi:hypothetical protein
MVLTILLAGCATAPVIQLSPLEDAAAKGQANIVREKLERGVDPADRNTALMHAALHGHIEIMNLLINKGADINWKNPKDKNRTPLMAAAENGKPEITRLLLEKGADANARLSSGSTALHFASMRGHVEVMKLLLGNGADINAADEDGMTALIGAALFDRTEAARILLDKGADINFEYKKAGLTALSMAAMRCNANTVKLLLERGADISNVDNNNGDNRYTLTVLSSVAMGAAGGENNWGCTGILKTLAEKGGDIESAISGLNGYIDHLSRSKYADSEPFQKLINNARAGAQLLDREKRRKIAGRTSAPKVGTESAAANEVRSDVDDLPAFKTKSNKNSYALVIGIENYRQKLPRADFASHDARTVTEYLVKVLGYPEENVVTLLNERALKSDFEKYLEKWLGNNVEKDGTVFLYYSGHWAPNPKTGEAFLVPYDGDPAFIDQTGYSIKRVYEALKKLPAREIIVAFDSCFSGSGGRSVTAKGARPLVMSLQSILVPATNMTVMSAASGEQISSTYEEKGHGLFTYFMLKGIKNEDVVKQDGSIAVNDLFSYIKPQVERIARKQYNNEQTPQLIEAKKN